MKVLGISAYYHDAAACLAEDGEVLAAVQEERCTRRKNDASFPVHAIRHCLRDTGTDPAGVDAVVFYEKPFLKFDRILETWLAAAPGGFASFLRGFPPAVKEKLRLKDVIVHELCALGGDRESWRSRLKFSRHHLSHAASAFYPSPFAEAAVVALDGVGEWTTTSIWHGHGSRLDALEEIRFPHSLGLLYSAFTRYLGFRVNADEYKVMGLAAYGRPLYAQLIRDTLVDLRDDGAFRLDMDRYGFLAGTSMTNRRFHRLFGASPRAPGDAVGQQHMDLAASIQAVLEEAVLAIARRAKERTGLRHLCLAGGVALNCTANGRLLRSGMFDGIWVQPAAGDAGGAIGAALAFHYLSADNVTRRADTDDDGMHGALLGPACDDEDVRATLERLGARYRWHGDDEFICTVAQALAEGKTVGWHQGRMEFGPRALGARSILANPLLPGMKGHLNRAIKRRESFRPFAPAVMQEHADDWFDIGTRSPYMLFTCAPRPGMPAIPAATHVDGSCRLQTVDAAHHPRFHRLLDEFRRLTGCPVLLNTSFNVRDEPIVMTPEDAWRCFRDSGLDLLAIGNFVLHATEQSP